ncbi:hypothetical protein [Aggregatilinea lenta]|uniref:hypothetical protein n=1 Tax=Aggregatilinea lenta TaxID=913108 RepID=UPI000E5A4EAB|nr:hypothetical protein [Aggregatilinea lenta]
MKLTLRTLLLIVDGLALVGLIAFSVLAALHPRQDGYLVAQIVTIVVVLVLALVLRRTRPPRLR